MTVRDLIAALSVMPPDAEIWVAYQLKALEDRYDEDLDDFIADDIQVLPLNVDDGTAVWIKAVDDLDHSYLELAQ